MDSPPAASPEVSRLVTKRRCPFGESPQQCKISASTERNRVHPSGQGTSADCAFEFLMNSHKLNTVDQKQPLYSTMMVTCWVCQQCKETMPCAFCEHSVCEMCVRQCDRCFGVFCSFCSTINYDSREDRPLCLTCNAEEFKRQRRWELPTSAAPWNGNILKGSFPQATA